MYDAQDSGAGAANRFSFALGPAPTHAIDRPVKIAVEELNFRYGDKQALFDVNLEIFDRETLALIGPSGCGKSTLLRCLNRANDNIESARVQGRVVLEGKDVYGESAVPSQVRRRFGWVAQKPDPYPFSIYENVAYGPGLHGLTYARDDADQMVETALRKANLWDEVKDRLNDLGTELSGGQQQRLCIARAIAHSPEVVLLDEPCSALDPIATGKVEELIDELRESCAVVLISHNMREVARVAQRVAVLDRGRLVEQGDAAQLFEQPEHAVSRAYLKGYNA